MSLFDPSIPIYIQKIRDLWRVWKNFDRAIPGVSGEKAFRSQTEAERYAEGFGDGLAFLGRDSIIERKDDI